MSDDGPQRKQTDEAFDVVWMRGPTEDGQGARVVRARPGRIDAGEVRPLRSGRPLMSSGEVVRLEQRADAPALYDVHVECEVRSATGETQTRTAAPAAQGSGPPQVATRAYRENWELTFGPRGESLN